MVSSYPLDKETEQVTKAPNDVCNKTFTQFSCSEKRTQARKCNVLFSSWLMYYVSPYFCFCVLGGPFKTPGEGGPLYIKKFEFLNARFPSEMSLTH